MLIDLHTHTAPSSYDALQTPEDLIIEAKALGLDALCLTEHDSFWDLGELKKLSQHHNILVLPGCEINTDEGHFLAFGLTEYVFGMHKLNVLREHVNRSHGILIAAHPYRRRFRLPSDAQPQSSDQMVRQASEGSTFQNCTAIETLNGRGSQEENQFSSSLAECLKLPCTAGSDSHLTSQIGTCATLFSNRISDLDSLISELRRGEFRPMQLR
ncbi:PHP domain-containing protein [SAR202 cluster bacterium AD-804-J14_MRT_500m]|nr:PHP domain-containing protein [SAR202 cluster bacterium AD-804-J14_MRT_500m]